MAGGGVQPRKHPSHLPGVSSATTSIRREETPSRPSVSGQFAWVGLVVALASPGPMGSVGRVACLAPVLVGETEVGSKYHFSVYVERSGRWA